MGGSNNYLMLDKLHIQMSQKDKKVDLSFDIMKFILNFKRSQLYRF